jgi:hypothetical protein
MNDNIYDMAIYNNRRVRISIFKIDFVILHPEIDFQNQFWFFCIRKSIFKINFVPKLIWVGEAKSILAANLIDFDTSSEHPDFAWEGHGGVQEAVGGGAGVWGHCSESV